MTSFFFSRSSLRKNNTTNNDNSKTLNSSSSSPSALRYAKKKKNTALLNESENSYFLSVSRFPTKNKEKTRNEKTFLFHVESFILLL